MEPSEQINAVVDKLADKLGVAVEQIAPIAETMVQEIARRGTAMTLLYLLVAVLGALLIVVAYRLCILAETAAKDDPRNEPPVAPTVTAIVCAIGGLILFGAGLLNSCLWAAQAYAPTLHLVETMLR